MSPSIRLLCFSLVTLLPALASAAPDIVGDYGDIDAIQFVGNDTFSSKQIRSALSVNLDVLLAGHPAAPMDELLQILDQKVTDGYLHLGFADVDVTTRFDEARSVVIVAVVEGPRYLAGRIEVAGVVTVPIDRLKERITSPQPDTSQTWVPPELAEALPRTQKPLWPVGKPASFAMGHWQHQYDAFQKAFQSLGYFDTTFDVTTRPDPDGSAVLVISVRDEGPRAVLGEIEVVGNQQNSAEDIIRFLDVPVGTVLDADLKRQLEYKLIDSARFVRHDVEIITPPFGNEPAILRVKLLEYADAPPLFKPFSPNEATMIQLARRLNTLQTTDDDVELRIIWPVNAQADIQQEQPAGAIIAHVDLVISHKRSSCLLHARAFSHPDRQLFDVWLHLDPTHASLSSPQHKLRFETQHVQQSVIGTVKWTAQPPDDEGRMSNLLFGVGAKGNADHTLAPFVLQASAAPVAALREAHVHAASMTLSDGVLSIENPKHHLAIASETGQLLRFEAERGPQSQVMIKSQPGLYEQIKVEYEKQNAGSRVISSADTPISNLLSFLATCAPEPLAETGAVSTESIARLTQSLLKRGAFRAFDDLLLDILNDPDDSFALPPETTANLKKIGAPGWYVFILPAARLVLPKPSWAWSITREFVFTRTRQSEHPVQAIQALLADPETGPVTNLVASLLLGPLHPQLRIEFARRGLDRLRPGRFSRDYEPFLQDDSAIGRLIIATAQTLQEIDDHEIDTIVSHLPISDPDQKSLARALRQFPLHNSDSPIVVLRAALDEAWEPLIEPRVRAMLEMLAN